MRATRGLLTDREAMKPRRTVGLDSERGSATIWVICILMLIMAAAGWALLWLCAQSARHAAERAADSAALAAAGAALNRLATQAGPDPCTSATQAAGRVDAEVVACTCAPLDCEVTVQRSAGVFDARGRPGGLPYRRIIPSGERSWDRWR